MRGLNGMGKEQEKEEGHEVMDEKDLRFCVKMVPGLEESDDGRQVSGGQEKVGGM